MLDLDKTVSEINAMYFGGRLPKLTVYYSKRLSNWGINYYTEHRIVINEKLTANDAFALQVLKHEVAHQAAYSLYRENRNHHGRRFREICRLLGTTPSRNGYYCLKCGRMGDITKPTDHCPWCGEKP